MLKIKYLLCCHFVLELYVSRFFTLGLAFYCIFDSTDFKFFDLLTTLLLNRAFSVEQTREERKMEAIMKAFEKMAKREERRKEALARLDKKHVDVKVIVLISCGHCGLSSFPVVIVDCPHFLWSLWIVLISCGHCGLSSFPVVIVAISSFCPELLHPNCI